MRLPAYDELIPEQLNVYDAPLDKPLFVAGPPGSGKTVLAVWRARVIAEAGQTTALVTFNRMLRRLANLLLPDNVQTYTMHTFSTRDYARRVGYRTLSSYSLPWKEMLDTLDGRPNSGPGCSHLVIDEGQDLEEGFFKYAQRYAAGVLTVFADEDQSLGIRRTTLSQIKRAAKLPDPLLLTVNHRNTAEIAAVAEHFHSGLLPAATVKRGRGGRRPRLIRSQDHSTTVRFISNFFRNFNGTVGVIVTFKATAQTIYAALKAELAGRRVDMYVSRQDNEDTIELLTPGITILTKESVKGQEFDTVFVLELLENIPCSDAHSKRIMYMLCSRARDNLFLVYGPEALTTEAEASLPGAHLLER